MCEIDLMIFWMVVIFSVNVAWSSRLKRTFIHMINKYGERRSPCLRPLLLGKYPLGLPLIITENWGVDTQVMIREEKFAGIEKATKTFSKKFQLTESKALVIYLYCTSKGETFSMIIINNLLSRENIISNPSTTNKSTLILTYAMRKPKLKFCRKNLCDAFVNNIVARNWSEFNHI